MLFFIKFKKKVTYMKFVYGKLSRARYIILLIYHFFSLMKWTIFYVSSIGIIIIISAYLGNVDLTLRNITTILIGEYISTSIWEDIMQFFVILFQLFPAFAFLEVRTMTKEEKQLLKVNLLSNHIIITGGLNHIAHRASETLGDLKIPYLFIISESIMESDLDADAEAFMEEIHEKDIILIRGSATSLRTLKKAGIENAKGIIITGEDETRNVVLAKKAKILNPEIRTVMRIFREETAEIYKKTGYVDEFISSSLIANMVYVLGCYLNVDVQYPPTIRFIVESNSHMIDKQRDSIEKSTGITILGIMRRKNIIRENVIIELGDRLFIYGNPADFKSFISYNLIGK